MGIIYTNNNLVKGASEKPLKGAQVVFCESFYKDSEDLAKVLVFI